MAKTVIWMDPADNVATALADLEPGDAIVVTAGGQARELRAADPVPFGHKVAVAAIPAGAEVLKYGEVIGRAQAAIPAGGLVHTHNCVSLRGVGTR